MLYAHLASCVRRVSYVYYTLFNKIHNFDDSYFLLKLFLNFLIGVARHLISS